MAGDDYLLLYAYDSSGGVDQSLLNPSPNKLWITARHRSRLAYRVELHHYGWL